MATVYSIPELANITREVIRKSQRALSLLMDIESHKEAMFAAGELSDTIESTLQGELNVFGSQMTEVKDLADSVDGTPVFPAEARINQRSGYASCAVDVTGANHLTAVGGTPFSVFDDSDTVKISHAEDSDHNCTRAVTTAADTTLLLSTDLAGSDNAADTSIRVLLRDR